MWPVSEGRWEAQNAHPHSRSLHCSSPQAAASLSPSSHFPWRSSGNLRLSSAQEAAPCCRVCHPSRALTLPRFWFPCRPRRPHRDERPPAPSDGDGLRALMAELQVIWYEVGEQDAARDKMLLELQRECSRPIGGRWTRRTAGRIFDRPSPVPTPSSPPLAPPWASHPSTSGRWT